MSRLEGFALNQFRTEIEDVVGRENVSDTLATLQEAAVDQYWATHMWRERLDDAVLPLFVVYPCCTKDVARVVRICNTYRVPVVPRGGGSGTQGGAATLFGGIVLDLSKMDRILEIDHTSMVLNAQAGINGAVLEERLNAEGVMLAHYPSSAALATLGGYVAARGSGVMSTRYGKAEDMVLSCTVVLPDGSVVNTLPVPNHAAGPGLLQLFVGSEGTYGIITEVRIRIEPLPERREFRAFTFADMESAIDAGRLIMISRVYPAVIRLYDEAAALKSLTPTGHQLAGIVMIVMVDGPEAIAHAQMQHIIDIVVGAGGIDHGSDEGRHWWEHRYDFYRPPLQPGYPQLYGTFETVTTFRHLPALYRAKQRLVQEEYAQWGARYTAHFSHWYPWGAMIYDRFYIDEPPADPLDALRLHNEIWAKGSRINLAHGGALNEHHGIGVKLGWMMREQNPEWFDLLQKVKNTLDPRGIMNPGKLGFLV